MLIKCAAGQGVNVAAADEKGCQKSNGGTKHFTEYINISAIGQRTSNQRNIRIIISSAIYVLCMLGVWYARTAVAIAES